MAYVLEQLFHDFAQFYCSRFVDVNIWFGIDVLLVEGFAIGEEVDSEIVIV